MPNTQESVSIILTWYSGASIESHPIPHPAKNLQSEGPVSHSRSPCMNS